MGHTLTVGRNTNRIYCEKEISDYIDEEDNYDHCRLFLAKYKVPKEIVFLEELPKNATGKIQKAQLANN